MSINELLPKGLNVLWVDFLANGARLANSEYRKEMVRKAKESGVTHLVVDAKIPYGHTTYPSRYALHVGDWSDNRFQEWRGKDFLREIIREARGADLKIFANVDVFAEGTKKTRDGLAFEKKEWQVAYINPESSKLSAYAEDHDDDTIFVNPIHPEVVNHQLSILEEIVSGYDIDGIVLDRCRYPNVHADFSELSRSGFEAYIGQQVEQWPADILEPGPGGRRDEIKWGKWFPKWTEWRALNIKKFVQQARTVVKTAREDCLFGIYVGSWYPLYYQEGVNWASESYRTDLPWASADYHRSAYADELEFIMTGCYYPEVTVEEAALNERPASWYSVEGAINMSLEAINNKIPVIASLYLHDYNRNPEQFAKAVHMCRERTHGVMLFDAIYLEMYGWWDELHPLLQRT
ncbi:alpha amylase family protein [Cohnella yongneupensis]|uniref:Alpha amylase family protein n=1 Tax=Cohnella yongneupensis TaxID=425006 RepID=A0ABW0QU69_9BACL